jgi:hypothetical protein
MKQMRLFSKLSTRQTFFKGSNIGVYPAEESVAFEKREVIAVCLVSEQPSSSVQAGTTTRLPLLGLTWRTKPTADKIYDSSSSFSSSLSYYYDKSIAHFYAATL